MFEDLCLLFRSDCGAKLLLYLVRYEHAAVCEVAKDFKVSKSGVQQQADRFVAMNVLTRIDNSRIPIYAFNLDNPFAGQVRTLVEHVYTHDPMAKMLIPNYYDRLMRL